MSKKDLSAVKSLMQSIPNFWHENWTNETLFRALHTAGDIALVFTEDNQIQGCIFGYDCGFRGYIAGLAVSEVFRGRGIGNDLVNKIEKLLKNRGCELVITDVLKSSENFFLKCGWGYPQAVLLRKRLIEKETS